MIYRIRKSPKDLIGEITLPTSKSENNRALIILALSLNKFSIENASDSDDSKILLQALSKSETEKVFDVGHSGTAMRFLTAFFALKKGKRILTGSERMQERPIQLLVEALKKLGAKINYLKKEGFPPLEIEGGNLKSIEIEIDASMSSQYLSALALIAPSLPNGLRLILKGDVISRPYLKMTLKMMERLGVQSSLKNSILEIKSQEYNSKSIEKYSIEGDWSAASYWYEMSAFAEKVDLQINGLQKDSLQGDASVADYYEAMGVVTSYNSKGIHLSKKLQAQPLDKIHTDLSNTPDLAQTLAITYAAKEMYAELYGLKTLRIKETDRIKALINELQKIGAIATDLDSGNLLIPKKKSSIKPPSTFFETYSDHRMAMCLAPLAMIFDEISIANPEVVSKSYPAFWNDLKKVGYQIDEISQIESTI